MKRLLAHSRQLVAKRGRGLSATGYRLPAGENGFVLILVIIEMGLFLFILSAIAQSSLSNYVSSRADLSGYAALNAAEAGADDAVFGINSSNSYTGTNTTCPISTTGENPVTLYNDSRGKATFETCITAGTIANEEIVYSTGKTYLPHATTPYKTRTVREVIEGTAVTSNYAVETGPGGLTMTNSASILEGPVYVGGTLSMSNTSTIGNLITSLLTPVAVSVGNYACPKPADSTYPALCSSGQPITLTNQAHIYGNVSADGQTSGSGMSEGGLVASSGVANTSLPNYNRDGQIAAVTSTMTSSAASCSNSQIVTWPANVHITGNVNLSNNCIVIISGNAWIDGNFNVSNNATILVLAGLGSTPTVMVDGSGGIKFSNQAAISTNLLGTGVLFITYWSAASCSPNCESVTGTDLANSANVSTITLSNQGLGVGSSFYARWSEVNLSNNGSIGSILGQTIILNNTGNISFGGGGNASLSNLTYSVRYYQQL